MKAFSKLIKNFIRLSKRTGLGALIHSTLRLIIGCIIYIWDEVYKLVVKWIRWLGRFIDTITGCDRY